MSCGFYSYSEERSMFSNKNIDKISYEAMKEIAEEINKYVEEKREEKETAEKQKKNEKCKKKKTIK